MIMLMLISILGHLAELRRMEAELQDFLQANEGHELDPDSMRDTLDANSRLVLDLSTMKETQTQRPFLSDSNNISKTHCAQ